MKNKITEMVFILDKSGSMAGYEEDTVGGFNAMIERQRRLDGKAYVSTVLFSNNSAIIHDREDLNDVKPLRTEDFIVGGGTALLDAIGASIDHIANVHKYARPEDVPEHTVFVINTDGMENASYMYDADKVKGMIKIYGEKYGWEFIFLAANIDAVKTAGNIGIRRERAMNFTQSHEGVRRNYKIMSDVMCCMRSESKKFNDIDISKMEENEDENENG